MPLFPSTKRNPFLSGVIVWFCGSHLSPSSKDPIGRSKTTRELPHFRFRGRPPARDASRGTSRPTLTRSVCFSPPGHRSGVQLCQSLYISIDWPVSCQSSCQADTWGTTPFDRDLGPIPTSGQIVNEVRVRRGLLAHSVTRETTLVQRGLPMSENRPAVFV